MNMNLYSVEDKLAGTFTPPVMYENDALVERAYKSALNDPSNKSIMACNAGDYALYKIGEMDLKTGEIKSCKDFVCNLIDLKSVK